MPKKLIIDGKEIEVADGTTLLQACEQAGSEIPRFCYHERLSIAGNCRMCLVEVEGAPKPIASCAQTVNELRPNPDGSPNVVHTKSETVKKAREGVMEFLLINHPLDCPICDQGGECDLQDQAMAFGIGGSRYHENKRAVEDKYIGPLIKTMMTRCIHCTRCVRFMTEVAGVEELGLISRGEDAEITTYLEKGILSEMSANAVDLCPVGALTHRPWAHNARPWELRKTESIDVMDAVGSNIRVDTRGAEVMRILPRNNDAVNEEWISDKTRHIVDGLRSQRLDQPYVRKDGRLVPASWDEVLDLVAERVKAAGPEKIGVVAGDLTGAEEMFALKELMDALGGRNMDCRGPHEVLDPAAGRAGYVFNTTIDAIDDADAILIIGSNPRHEAAVLNARIRGRWRRGGLQVGLIGVNAPLTYAVTHIGSGIQSLADVADGKHGFAKVLADAKRPMVIVGAGAYGREDGAVVMSLAARIAEAAKKGADEGWAVFNVLHTGAARVAGLDLGFVPGEGGLATAEMVSGGVDVLWLLGADEFDVTALGDTFVIYQGTHGDAGAHRADVILPGAAYTEKSASYANTEGRVQIAARAVFPPGDAKEDWAIIRALSSRVGHTLSYDTLGELRAKMHKAAPVLARIDEPHGGEGEVEAVAKLANQGGMADATAFEPVIPDFYLTNPIARASAVMAELSALNKAANAAGSLNAAE
ncbi:MAG: NADH-quinone oxidoreductase subunit G [Hyphomicrobiaceae bacterium]|nr:NADH-quinone oxidoreductase subunit G [Hyphomicrobiaceae bacterium]MCC0010016.1 NADH-quinone oxidoreductase subunit G [Hyphomicrobiaceae bacterium]